MARASALWATAPKVASALVETWLGAAERWATDAVPFHLVFLIDD